MFILKVATRAASLSDLRSIHSAIVLYKNIISLLYDTYFNGDLHTIDELLMKDFSLLDGLYKELDTAVGQLVSDYSVMEGYSNTVDEISDKLNNNTREVNELKDLYRYLLVGHVFWGVHVFIGRTGSKSCSYNMKGLIFG